METVKITSLYDLESWTESQSKGTSFIYRGQENDSWDLTNSFRRFLGDKPHGKEGLNEQHPSKLKDEEKEFIYKLEKELWDGWKGFAGTDCDLCDLYLLALAQHHRLPTRLLDWTLNIKVALKFACGQTGYLDSSVDGVIFALKDSHEMDSGTLSQVIFENGIFSNKQNYFSGDLKIKFFQVKIWSPRVYNQSAVLSFSENPFIFTEPKGFGSITKLIIPKDNKSKLLRELKKEGIDSSFLFPDLDDYSRCRKEYYIFNSYEARLSKMP